ncbi:hypothetical protein ACWCYZ_29610 [Streptomyces virginiae]
MLDHVRAGHSNSTIRLATRVRRLAAALAAVWTVLFTLTGPAQAATLTAARALTQETTAPVPPVPTATAPATPVQQPAAPAPPYDTQPPGVSAYLPAETLITILIITAVFILGLRYGPAVATAAIKALARFFQNPPPGP